MSKLFVFACFFALMATSSVQAQSNNQFVASVGVTLGETAIVEEGFQGYSLDTASLNLHLMGILQGEAELGLRYGARFYMLSASYPTYYSVSGAFRPAFGATASNRYFFVGVPLYAQLRLKHLDLFLGPEINILMATRARLNLEEDVIITGWERADPIRRAHVLFVAGLAKQFNIGSRTYHIQF